MDQEYQFDSARFDSPVCGRLKAWPGGEGAPATSAVIPFRAGNCDARVSSVRAGPRVVCPSACVCSTCREAYSVPRAPENRQDSGEES